jgi:uncharacterized iron-regulated membrane protein
MIRGLRGWHRWTAGIFALFLFITGTTGVLLALKNHFGELKTPMAKAEKVQSEDELVSMDTVVKAGIATGIPELKSLSDIERIDYRPKQNVFKVVTHEGYKEVQVDGKTGKVLSVTIRRDQFIEDIHDFSFFNDPLRNYWLPIVGLAELLLIGTGVSMLLVVQRRKALAKRKLAGVEAKESVP